MEFGCDRRSDTTVPTLDPHFNADMLQHLSICEIFWINYWVSPCNNFGTVDA